MIASLDVPLSPMLHSVHSKNSISIDIHMKLNIDKHLRCLTERKNVQGEVILPLKRVLSRNVERAGLLSICVHAFAGSIK